MEALRRTTVMIVAVECNNQSASVDPALNAKETGNLDALIVTESL